MLGIKLIKWLLSLDSLVIWIVIFFVSPASLVTVRTKSFNPAWRSFSPSPVTVVGSVTSASIVTFVVPIGTFTLYSKVSGLKVGSNS